MPTTVDSPQTTESAPPAQVNPEACRELAVRVEGVRSRHRMTFFLSGLCAALAVFAAVFLGFSALDILFKLSVNARVFWMALGLGGIAAMAYFVMYRPWSKLGGQVVVAREVEKTYPQLENQLSTALEYGASKKLVDGSSPELVQALLRQAEERAHPLDFGRAVKWRRVAVAGLIAFFVAGLVGGYAAWNSRLFNATWKRFLSPTSQTPAPTLTVIDKITPNDGEEVPLASNVQVRVETSGYAPKEVILHLECAGVAEDRVMDKLGPGEYSAFLSNLRDHVTFRVQAGDAGSEDRTIKVYREPQIEEFTLKIEYPAYTGKAPEALAPGLGEVKALHGTKVQVNIKANTELSAARLVFAKAGKLEVPVDGVREANLAFSVEQDDRYYVEIVDEHGRPARTLSEFRVQVQKDGMPKVTIRKPEPDLMVHKEQVVKVEIQATDDYGVREIGIVHSLGLEEKKTLVKRNDDPCPAKATGTLKWDLSTLGLKGGEVIAYYAYAIDNDTVTGPKMAKSEIHFLTVYDEEEYNAPNTPNSHQPTPPSVKALDKLIEAQKKLLQETFALSRLKDAEKNAEKGDKPEEAAQKGQPDVTKTAKAQHDLRAQLDKMVEDVKKELEKPAEKPKDPKADEPFGPQPDQKHPIGEKELKLMADAGVKMDAAAEKLDDKQPTPAVPSEMEALRALSETRRILLSDKEGDPRFKMAMNKSAKKRNKTQQDQKAEDMRQAQDEMQQMPPMMEREKQLEEDLDKLEAKKKDQAKQNQKPQDPQAEAQKKADEEEQRRLKRKTEDDLAKLAREAQERADNLKDLANKNPELKDAADKAQDAADKMKEAADKAKQDQPAQAKDKANEGAKDLKQSMQGIQNAQQQAVRDQMNALQKEAQDLAQKQQQLADATKAAQQEQQAGEPKAGEQPQGGDPKQGNPKQGDPKQASGQGGKPDEKTQAKLNAIAGKQRDLAEDMKDLGQRIDKAAEQAKQEGLEGSKAMEQAKEQSAPQNAGAQSSQKAADNLQKGDAKEGEYEQQKSAKTLEAVAKSLQEAVQKTQAQDLNELAAALKKAKDLANQQAAAGKEIAEKKDPAAQGAKQDKIEQAANDLANAAAKIETLKQQNRAASTKANLEAAAKSADEASKALGAQENEKAQEYAGQSEKQLRQAATEMERAASKALDDRAKEAQRLAREAREAQEKAAGEAKDVPEKKEGQALTKDEQKQRDDASATEREAAKKADRLEKTLEGLAEMAKEINPDAAQTAKTALDTSKEKQLPQSMQDLAKGIEKMGAPRERPDDAKAPTPKEAGDKGQQIAQDLKKIEQGLKQFQQEATGDELSRMQALEEQARDAQKAAKDLADKADKQGSPDPQGKPDPNAPPKDNLGEQASKLEKQIQNLEQKLKNQNPNSPEAQSAKQALDSAKEGKAEADKPKPNTKPTDTQAKTGGSAFNKTHKALGDLTAQLRENIERIERARDVRQGDVEEAPNSYRPLVERYYKAMTEDVNDK